MMQCNVTIANAMYDVPIGVPARTIRTNSEPDHRSNVENTVCDLPDLSCWVYWYLWARTMVWLRRAP
jgi:hypothetical protein